MSVFRIVNNVSSFNEEVLRDYADVYFHCEDTAIIEGHMAIIAPLSPFCHKFFKTRRNAMVVDMFFPHIRHSVILSAIMIMYGKEVHVPKSDCKRVQSFLNLLQVKYKVDSTLEASQEKMDKEIRVDGDQETPAFETEKTQEKNTDQTEFSPWPENLASSSEVLASPRLDLGPSSLKDDDDDDDDDMEGWYISTTVTDKEKLDDISHTIERVGGERKRYKCKRCPALSTTFYVAQQHFKDKHQDLEGVANLITNVYTERKKLKKDFEALTKATMNTTVMEHECSDILDKFQALLSDLESLPSSSIPVQQLKKKQEFLKKIKMDMSSVNIFMKNL